MMLQLDPPLPVCNVAGNKGLAHLVIDYGVEHNLVWVVAWDDSRELWCVPNPELRVQENLTFGRPKEVKRAG
jgi:hypothetical protein